MYAKMTKGSAGNNIMDDIASSTRDTPILTEDMIDMDVTLETQPRKRIGP